MRIIRFVADDGRVLCGEPEDGNGVVVVSDVCGVLGTDAAHGTVEQLKGKRAVVADDDVNMRQMVCAVLEKAGCVCTVCADGAEALVAVGAEGVDLVVSDIMMPHHSGYEIFSAARRRHAEVPVLLITGFGYDPSHSLVKAEQDGLQAVLYKPITPQQLMAELGKAINAPSGTGPDLLKLTNERACLSALLAPISPSNIICIGRNYPAPASESGPSTAIEELEVFMKPTTALQASGEPIRIPKFDGEDIKLDCEGELAIVIGTAAKDVQPERAFDHVLGYTIANDVTARRWQTKTGPPQWMRGKGFDTFCPLGPALVTREAVEDPDDLEITTHINGTLVRFGSTAQMIRPVARIISELSRRFTLEPGTLILTGSPPRLASQDGNDIPSLKDGDVVVVEIEGLGRLVNRVMQS